jgi:hypothetical protein
MPAPFRSQLLAGKIVRVLKDSKGGKCHVDLPSLIWRVKDAFPRTERPTVGQVQRALDLLQREHRIRFRNDLLHGGRIITLADEGVP